MNVKKLVKFNKNFSNFRNRQSGIEKNQKLQVQNYKGKNRSLSNIKENQGKVQF